MPASPSDGITVRYRLAGTPGKPRVVFVNSLGSDLTIWDEVAALLAADFEILLYDLRGHGGSSATPAPYSLARLADDLLGLLGDLTWDASAIVGLSVGGLIAQKIAVRYPERLSALVLMDTAAKIGTTEAWNDRIRAVESGGLASISEAIIGRWLTPAYTEAHPNAAADWRRMLEDTSVAGYAGTCAALRDADLTGEVAKIRAPTLVMVGDQDLSTPPDLVRATAERIPGSRFAVIEGAGHLPCIEQPGAVAALIADHLKGAANG